MLGTDSLRLCTHSRMCLRESNTRANLSSLLLTGGCKMSNQPDVACSRKNFWNLKEGSRQNITNQPLSISKRKKKKRKEKQTYNYDTSSFVSQFHQDGRYYQHQIPPWRLGSWRYQAPLAGSRIPNSPGRIWAPRVWRTIGEHRPSRIRG